MVNSSCKSRLHLYHDENCLGRRRRCPLNHFDSAASVAGMVAGVRAAYYEDCMDVYISWPRFFHPSRQFPPLYL